jgi:hypothetical protein
MKACACCNTEKPLELFYKEPRGLMGVKRLCIECFNKQRREATRLRSPEQKTQASAKSAARRAAMSSEALAARRLYLDNWRRKNSANVETYRRRAKNGLYNTKDRTEYTKAWVQQNREKVLARSRHWQKRNPDKVVLYVQLRDAQKRRALAQWDIELTKLVTLEAAALCRLRAKALGGKWHVDHVVPLRGKIVSGLHVWNNLQVLPAKVNISKGNKFCEAIA